MKQYDIAIVGAGPAGLAVAAAAYDAGAKSIVLIEREAAPGGILNQCIHAGFGLHTFNEELTGPEYAARFIAKVNERGIDMLLSTMVLSIADDKTITAMNRTDGVFTIKPKAIVLCMGCRERSRGALNIPGFRPAGIYSAGTAQKLVNIMGYMPGREVVILGSGDIGLIMARRMTLEGAKVKVVAELMPYSGGLKRNIVQCLDDFGIPLKLSHTVVDIRGRERVEGVTIAEVGADLKPIAGTEEYYPCDTLLLSCGLIPENELSRGMGVGMHPVTGGPVVNESLETDIEGVFSAGNALHVHDLVDYVSEEAAAAGRNAAKYALGESTASSAERIKIELSGGIRYAVPSVIDPAKVEENLTVRMRVGGIMKNKRLCVFINGNKELARPRQIMAPGEMEQVIIKREMLDKYAKIENILICTEDM
jgi:NADPH-dependent 2,4-dienoyl-CoA reductase/sulfur reductase-like enzyme